MKRLVFVVAMLIAASNASPAAFYPPLVSKDRPPALVRNASTSRSPNPETNHLFERFVDWLKRQPH